MSETLVAKSDFPSIVAVYNTDGKKAAYRYVREQYGIKHPFFVFERIKKCGSFTYNEQNDSYLVGSTTADEAIFMSIDELCGTSPAARPVSNNHREPETHRLDELIHTLISDRLLELSKYVILDVENRRILVDRTCMEEDGYLVEMK